MALREANLLDGHTVIESSIGGEPPAGSTQVPATFQVRAATGQAAELAIAELLGSHRVDISESSHRMARPFAPSPSLETDEP